MPGTAMFLVSRHPRGSTVPRGVRPTVDLQSHSGAKGCCSEIPRNWGGRCRMNKGIQRYDVNEPRLSTRPVEESRTVHPHTLKLYLQKSVSC